MYQRKHALRLMVIGSQFSVVFDIATPCCVGLNSRPGCRTSRISKCSGSTDLLPKTHRRGCSRHRLRARSVRIFRVIALVIHGSIRCLPSSIDCRRMLFVKASVAAALVAVVGVRRTCATSASMTAAWRCLSGGGRVRQVQLLRRPTRSMGHRVIGVPTLQHFRAQHILVKARDNATLDTAGTCVVGV